MATVYQIGAIGNLWFPFPKESPSLAMGLLTSSLAWIQEHMYRSFQPNREFRSGGVGLHRSHPTTPPASVPSLTLDAPSPPPPSNHTTT